MGLEDENLPANAMDMGLIPDLERFHMLGAAEPMHHNYLACALPLACCNY